MNAGCIKEEGRRKTRSLHANDVQSSLWRNWTTQVWYLSIPESKSTQPIVVTCFCHDSCCLPCVRTLVVSLSFGKTVLQHTEHTDFLTFYKPSDVFDFFVEYLMIQFIENLLVSESMSQWTNYENRSIVDNLMTKKICGFFWFTVYYTNGHIWSVMSVLYYTVYYKNHSFIMPC